MQFSIHQSSSQRSRLSRGITVATLSTLCLLAAPTVVAQDLSNRTVLHEGAVYSAVPAVSNEDAKKLFPNGWNEIRPYLRVVPQPTALLPHDHVELQLDLGAALRFNDPRRFGCFLFTTEPPRRHKLLRNLAPEPLTRGFDGAYLHRVTRHRRVAIKSLLLNGRLVTGVGNIYASEALFRARVRPG